jgi:two-component system, CitB family, sensor kinase
MFGDGSSDAFDAVSARAAHLASDARGISALWDRTRDHMELLHEVRIGLDRDETAYVGRLLAPVDPPPGAAVAEVGRRIRPPRVASLVVAMAEAARGQGVRLRLDGHSRLGSLPDLLDETDAVSIIGNLVQNACDAVASVVPARRRVTLLIGGPRERVRIRVRDWGPGLHGCPDEALFTRGFTTKPGHTGLGLVIVRDLVTRAGGALTVERLPVGSAFEAVVPHV